MGKKGSAKKRAQRATSNVFAMFDQTQVQEFKEAFNMIDQDRDGFISQEDLKDMMASLGQTMPESEIEAMIKEAPGAINFTMFLTLMGEKLNGTDPEEVICNAFKCFDPNGAGFINEDQMRELLKSMGERFTEDECDDMFNEAEVDKKGNFNYIEYVRLIKHGPKQEE
jgi:Ca2+-binding EF-hand superfamily protein